VACAAGQFDRAVTLLEHALDTGAAVSRPAARLVCAEALARLGRTDDAASEVRRAILEPVRSGDLPWALVPQLTRIQGLIARARGDLAQAQQRFGEAAAGWRAPARRDAGTELVTNFVDLGRPPIVGLVEPARELERLAADLAELTEVP
jgi:hypothetical protein